MYSSTVILASAIHTFYLENKTNQLNVITKFVFFVTARNFLNFVRIILVKACEENPVKENCQFRYKIHFLSGKFSLKISRLCACVSDTFQR